MEPCFLCVLQSYLICEQLLQQQNAEECRQFYRASQKFAKPSFRCLLRAASVTMQKDSERRHWAINQMPDGSRTGLMWAKLALSDEWIVPGSGAVIDNSTAHQCVSQEVSQQHIFSGLLI